MKPLLEVLFFALCLFGANAWSQTPSIWKSLKIEAIPNSIRVTFPDGREAELQVYESPVLQGVVSMQMTETLCEGISTLPHCELHLPYKTFVADFAWTHHPDPQRLHHAVKKKSSGSTSSLVDFTYPFFATPDSLQKAGQKILDQDATLSCNDDRWISQRRTRFRWKTIDTWSAETNRPNLETAVKENQTISGAFNLRVWGRSGSEHPLRSGLYFDTDGPMGLAFQSTGPVMTVTRDRHNELCQSTFAMMPPRRGLRRVPI